MILSDKAEEILETLWVSSEEKNQDSISLNFLGLDSKNQNINRLISTNLIEITMDDSIKLTEKGKKESEDIVRRHRLAERLLIDVLDIKVGLINEAACKFEHILHKGIDDSICTLLGHPAVCPHGHKIPSGKCCKEERETTIKVVSPLSKLNPGEKGKISYIYAIEAHKLQKLMSMGVLPGKEIKLLQIFPSYLFEVGNTQFAVDDEIADCILVRIEK